MTLVTLEGIELPVVLSLWVSIPLRFAYQIFMSQLVTVPKLQLGSSIERLLWLEKLYEGSIRKVRTDNICSFILVTTSEAF